MSILRPRVIPEFVISAALLLGLGVFAKDPQNPRFPVGYRSWTHVKSALVGPSSPFSDTQGGLHHIYANEKAMEGLSSGHFPDGAKLVFDLVEAREKNGLTVEGPRRRVDVMVKDSQAHPKSGGWWFGRYIGDDWEHESLSPAQREECFQCHQQPRTRDLVFSEFRK